MPSENSFQIRTQLSWTPGTKRTLVMIGDAIPHELAKSEAKLDWEAELDALVNDLVCFAMNLIQYFLIGMFFKRV
jgi:hypothetical protein